MIENLLLKSNFLGKDGFRWWIGHIPPATSWSLQKKRKPDSWGNRVKVRIMGYHPQNTVELKDEDLPWATVLLPATAGSGKGGKGKPIRIQPSDVVIGFFLDGDDAQQPVIFGVIGNSQYSVSRNPGPFTPFTGYTPETTPGDKIITKNDVGGASTDADKPKVSVDPNLANTLTNQTGKTYRAISDGVGQCVAFAGSNAQSEIQGNLKNASKEYKNLTGANKNKLISNLSKNKESKYILTFFPLTLIVILSIFLA